MTALVPIDAMPKKKISTTHAQCPECDGRRVCEVHGTVETEWRWDSPDGYDYQYGGADHALLQCRGCEKVFYWRSSWNSEDVDERVMPDGSTEGEYARTISTYPKPDSKTRPAWVSTIKDADFQLGSILDETYLAFDNRLYVLTAVGLRTAFDRSVQLLKVEGNTFGEKLAKLEDSGWIGTTERSILEVVVDAGNAAAHQGWRPSSSKVEQLISVMEIFLQKAFVVEKKALDLKPSIPARPKRIKAPKTPKAAPPAPPANK